MFIFLFLRGARFFLPFLALYFEQTLFSVTNVAIIMSTRSISTMVFEIPSGAISDLFGRKNTLILSSIVNIFTMGALYIGGSLNVFLVYAVLAGLSTSLVSGTDTALIHDELEVLGKTKLFKKILGNYFALWPAGAICGSLIGSFLSKTSLQLTVLVSFIPVLLGLLILFFLKEPQVEKEDHSDILKHSWKAFKNILHSKQLLLLVSAGTIGFSFGFSIYQLMPIYLDFKGLPTEYIGFVTASFFLTVSLGSYFSNFISEKLGNKTTLVLAILTAAILYLSATFIDSVLAVVFFVIGFGLFRLKKPIINHFINLEATSKNRATIVSIASFFDRIGLSLSILFLGHFADLYDINFAYMLSASLLLLAPMLYVFIRDDKKVE